MTKRKIDSFKERQMDIDAIVKQYNGEGYVTCDNTYAIIVNVGSEWGPDEWREVKYCGVFSKKRIHECVSLLIQKLRTECVNLDCNLEEYIGPVKRVECDWEDKRDCFEKVELMLWSMGNSILELNISIFSRQVMRTKRGGWHGLREYCLGKMKKKKMLEWMNSETIVNKCMEMISEQIKEYYLE